MPTRPHPRIPSITALTLLSVSCGAFAAQDACTAPSGPAITPVMELYTSEGCSSCPPADKWLSSLKGSGMVVQAFHVGYWDYIGWVDRFAAPAYTKRQHEVAERNKLRSVYTPQAVLNGQDLPAWGPRPPGGKEPARAAIVLTRLGADQFEAVVTPVAARQLSPSWSAYWTVTEHGHNSKCRPAKTPAPSSSTTSWCASTPPPATTKARAPRRKSWSFAASPPRPAMNARSTSWCLTPKAARPCRP